MRSTIFALQSNKRARKLHVKIALGTDAVAGSHGRNSEEFIYRVKDGRVKDGGDTPMDALMRGTSVSAESLGMVDKDRFTCARDGSRYRGHRRKSAR